MKIATEFPRRVREIENCWIPLSDGCRLAARIWLPEDAEQDPVPALLEYLPYRKRDATAEGDALRHPWFAGHGYAGVRVDMRGSGDSDGLLHDEYLKQEQDDALEVIAWLAAQPWCSGKVGMLGISWGGFNSLQIAARRPPALGAIITACSTDDRYADDVHYMGGCLLGENLSWAATMVALMSRPPDPTISGDRWRTMWLERLETMPVFVANWLEHQRRDAYWKHGSVCEDFAQIACPVYAVGGWADSYTNAIPRLLAGLRVPRKGLIGPWAHRWPHVAGPGPEIGFLQEALRWWDHWLKGKDTGIMDEPMLRAWMQESVPPRPQYQTRPGRWVAEPVWPPEDRIPARRFLNGDGLGEAPAPEIARQLRGRQSTGLTAGEWCPYGYGAELPTDQREEDGDSLLFDTPPLVERIEILGAPVVALDLAVDRPNALIAIRLNDVGPTGESTRVTYGLLNLTHRYSHEHPEPMAPGKRTTVRLQLNDVAHAFPAGHRIRVAISPTYWPTAWPSPELVTLTLFTGASFIDLPARQPRAEDSGLPPFAEPETPSPLRVTRRRAAQRDRTVRRDLASGESVLTVLRDNGAVRFDDIGLEVEFKGYERYRITEDDPLSAQAEVAYDIDYRRGGWRIRTESRTLLTSTRTEFLVEADLRAFESGRRVFSKSWNRIVSRDHL